MRKEGKSWRTRPGETTQKSIPMLTDSKVLKATSDRNCSVLVQHGEPTDGSSHPQKGTDATALGSQAPHAAEGKIPFRCEIAAQPGTPGRRLRPATWRPGDAPRWRGACARRPSRGERGGVMTSDAVPGNGRTSAGAGNPEAASE